MVVRKDPGNLFQGPDLVFYFQRDPRSGMFPSKDIKKTFENIVLRQDPDHFFRAVHDRKTSDIMLQHLLGRRFHELVFIDRDHIFDHHSLDIGLRQQVIQFKDRQRGR